jgi:hypothetical protein
VKIGCAFNTGAVNTRDSKLVNTGEAAQEKVFKGASLAIKGAGI